MSTPALNPLVRQIRAKYPGVYDDMDDAALTKAVLTKYPQYSDLAAPKGDKGELGGVRPPFIQMNKMFGTDDISALGRSPLRPTPQDTQTYQEHPTAATAAGLGGISAGAALAAPPTLPFLARFANAAKPYVIPALASLGISKAKELPVVGPVVQRIPYAEMLPWLFNPEKPKEGPIQEGAPLPANPYEQAQAVRDKRQFIKNAEQRAREQSQMETGVYPGAHLPEAPANVPVKTKIGGRYVLSPEEAQQAEQIQQIAKRRASERGMQYAAGMKPSGGKVGTP